MTRFWVHQVRYDLENCFVTLKNWKDKHNSYRTKNGTKIK